LIGLANSAALVCWWIASDPSPAPAVYAHQLDPYPQHIMRLIQDIDVPLVELVVAVERWAAGGYIETDVTYQDAAFRGLRTRWEATERLTPTASCAGCGLVPLATFRTGSGKLLCRDCWDWYCIEPDLRDWYDERS
jgi:hypothetical protein